MREVGGADDPGDEIGAETKVSVLERWVLPYIEDSALWPVLIVVIAHVVAFIAPLCLYAIRERSLVAMVAVAWLAFLTVQGMRYEKGLRGRFGSFSWLLLVTWAASGVAAYFGNRWDVI